MSIIFFDFTQFFENNFQILAENVHLCRFFIKVLTFLGLDFKHKVTTNCPFVCYVKGTVLRLCEQVLITIPIKAGCIDMMEKCDVLVVGAGMAGLSAAARLSEAGINVVLIG